MELIYWSSVDYEPMVPLYALFLIFWNWILAWQKLPQFVELEGKNYLFGVDFSKVKFSLIDGVINNLLIKSKLNRFVGSLLPHWCILNDSEFSFLLDFIFLSHPERDFAFSLYFENDTTVNLHPSGFKKPFVYHKINWMA